MDNTTDKADRLADRIDEQCDEIDKIVQRITSFADAVDNFLKNSEPCNFKTPGKCKTPDKDGMDN